jgi:hypothetical protein
MAMAKWMNKYRNTKTRKIRKWNYLKNTQ